MWGTWIGVGCADGGPGRAQRRKAREAAFLRNQAARQADLAEKAEQSEKDRVAGETDDAVLAHLRAQEEGERRRRRRRPAGGDAAAQMCAAPWTTWACTPGRTCE